MGYTNYLYQSRSFTAAEWAALLTEARRIIAAAMAQGISICDGMGEGKPVLDDTSIWINGDESKGESHETFVLSRVKPAARPGDGSDYFSFCKTARKPYDAVVVSILFAAEQIAPGAIRASSDGDGEAGPGKRAIRAHF